MASTDTATYVASQPALEWPEEVKPIPRILRRSVDFLWAERLQEAARRAGLQPGKLTMVPFEDDEDPEFWGVKRVVFVDNAHGFEASVTAETTALDLDPTPCQGNGGAAWTIVGNSTFMVQDRTKAHDTMYGVIKYV